jgi:PIN domain nuclease of toxin-antitoxin system
MSFLLDTHVFLWYISADSRLHPGWREEIQLTSNRVFLSVVSVWEIAVKHRLGKLPLPRPLEAYISAERVRHQIDSLPLDEASVLRAAELPAKHRDPFDRMLVCQAIEHGLTIVTRDPIFQQYPAQILDS